MGATGKIDRCIGMAQIVKPYRRYTRPLDQPAESEGERVGQYWPTRLCGKDEVLIDVSRTDGQSLFQLPDPMPTQTVDHRRWERNTPPSRSSLRLTNFQATGCPAAEGTAHREFTG